MASGMDAMAIVLGKPDREHSMQHGGIVRKQKRKDKIKKDTEIEFDYNSRVRQPT